MKEITASYDRDVSSTVGLDGRLPNRVFTLIPSTIVAVLLAREGIEARLTPFLCKKFMLAWNSFQAERETFQSPVVEVTHSNGRVFHRTRASPVWHRIRLPPVQQMWGGWGSWFVATDRRCYAWGINSFGRLGVNSKEQIIAQPMRVPVTPRNVQVFDEVTFFQPIRGGDWLGAGWNEYGQLADKGRPSVCSIPTPMPNSTNVLSWASESGLTVGLLTTGAVVCGDIEERLPGLRQQGQSGVLHTLTTLPLPVEGTVDQVAISSSAVFIRLGSRCFASGWNGYGQLGLDPSVSNVTWPTELPFPVTDIATFTPNTVFVSNGRVLVCGNNEYNQLSDCGATSLALTPLATPEGPLAVVALGSLCLLALVGDVWCGRGMNSDGRLLAKSDDVLSEWAPLPARAVCRSSNRLVQVTPVSVICNGDCHTGWLDPLPSVVLAPHSYTRMSDLEAINESLCCG